MATVSLWGETPPGEQQLPRRRLLSYALAHILTASNPHLKSIAKSGAVLAKSYLIKPLCNYFGLLRFQLRISGMS